MKSRQVLPNFPLFNPSIHEASRIRERLFCAIRRQADIVLARISIEVKTTAPTAEPTTAPTSEPTTAPTAEPTTAPTAEPTAEPSEAANPTEAVKSNEAGMPVETANSGSNATTSAKDKGGSHAMLWTAISVTLAGAITGTLVCVRKRRQMK